MVILPTLAEAIERYLAELRDELRAPVGRTDVPDIAALVDWLEQLRGACADAELERVLHCHARIRRAIDDGAFDTQVPTHGYLAFERVYHRWLKQFYATHTHA